jgi:hypothetical protein
MDSKIYLASRHLCSKKFPQIRIYDNQSKCYYQTLPIDDNKVILFNRQNYNLTPRIIGLHLTSSNSSSDDEDDVFNPNTQIIKLPREIIGAKEINSFIINIVAVHFAGKIIPMYMVISTTENRMSIFYKKYKSDYDKLRLDKDKCANIYNDVVTNAAQIFYENHIYVPPTITEFESLLKNPKITTKKKVRAFRFYSDNYDCVS